jgi:multimeric flavodoxin WrbA
LAGKLIEGAESAGAVTDKTYLRGIEIKYCLGCGRCLRSENAPCVINDGMAPLLERIRRADGLIFASPIYFGSVNGQMKVFLDRLNALFDSKYSALAGKKAALVFTHADADSRKSGVFNAVRMFRDAFAALNVGLVGWTRAVCHIKGEIAGDDAALRRARRLGVRLAGLLPDGR